MNKSWTPPAAPERERKPRRDSAAFPDPIGREISFVGEDPSDPKPFDYLVHGHSKPAGRKGS